MTFEYEIDEFPNAHKVTFRIKVKISSSKTMWWFNV